MSMMENMVNSSLFSRGDGCLKWLMVDDGEYWWLK